VGSIPNGSAPRQACTRQISKLCYRAAPEGASFSRMLCATYKTLKKNLGKSLLSDCGMFGVSTLIGSFFNPAIEISVIIRYVYYYLD
jgi:hypothetical protein